MNTLVGQSVESAGAPLAQRYRPGLRHGPAPERRADNRRCTSLDCVVRAVYRHIFARRARRREEHWQQALLARIKAIQQLTPEAQRLAFDTVKAQIAFKASRDAFTLEALAHACLAAENSLSLSPHAGQRRAASALLMQQFVELPTGEGKTLAVALAAAVMSLDGTPVHILTANDYLAERDAHCLSPFYAALGLSAGCVLPTMDESSRRQSYRCNVVYLTGKQAGFDWMRDALIRGPDAHQLVNQLGELTASRHDSRSVPIQRGLCAAILDEADSMLLDEARTPLILASPAMGRASLEHDGSIALGLAQMLGADTDYVLDKQTRQATLTDAGKVRLGQLAQRVPGVWRASRYRDERVRQALVALHLWRLDRDYVVLNQEIQLVDEQTGRALPDRRLQHGLHGLLELKERCKPTAENETVASIAFQSFFLRYLQLVGTSATLAEARGELARVYRSTLVQIPSIRPSRLRRQPARVFRSRAEQFDELIEEVHAALAQDRPVLIGTRSVEQSRGVSALLRAHSIAHSVLDASQDVDEARVIAEAGKARCITVATNMAGRGTDIPLGEGVAERGGLHLVSLAFNDSRRVDRQLIGRTARQGDPGSFRQLWSLDDPELEAVLPKWLLSKAQYLLRRDVPARTAQNVVLLAVRFAQKKLEHQQAYERRNAFDCRERLTRHVALDGHSEHPV